MGDSPSRWSSARWCASTARTSQPQRRASSGARRLPEARVGGMRIGVVVPMAVSDGPGQMPTWPQVRAFGQRAEAVGLDSVWVCDHLLSGPPEQGMHEGWTIMAALAASTHRVELGQLV